MADYNHLAESDAIRKLAEYTEILRTFLELAITYNINIITGSMPYAGWMTTYIILAIYAVAMVLYELYEKLHITPDEIAYWGMVRR